MVDLHDLFSSLLFIGIMGFILNFGVEMVIEVLLGMKYVVHIREKEKIPFLCKTAIPVVIW